MGFLNQHTFKRGKSTVLNVERATFTNDAHAIRNVNRVMLLWVNADNVTWIALHHYQVVNMKLFQIIQKYLQSTESTASVYDSASASPNYPSTFSHPSVQAQWLNIG